MNQGTIRVRGLTAATLLLLGYAAVTALLGWGTGGALASVRAPGTPPLDAAVSLAAALGAWLVLSVLVGSTVVALVAAVLAGVGSRAYRSGIYPRKDRFLFDFNERYRREMGRPLLG